MMTFAMDMRELSDTEIELIAGGGAINWRSVGVATVGGAVGGGVAGLFTGAMVGASAGGVGAVPGTGTSGSVCHGGHTIAW